MKVIILGIAIGQAILGMSRMPTGTEISGIIRYFSTPVMLTRFSKALPQHHVPETTFNGVVTAYAGKAGIMWQL